MHNIPTAASGDSLSSRLGRMLKLQQGARMRMQQNVTESEFAVQDDISPGFSVLAEFDLLLPVVARHWGYSAEDLQEIKGVWRNTGFMPEVVAQWREEVVRHHLEVPTLSADAQSKDTLVILSRTEKKLGKISRDKADETWICDMVDMFPRNLHLGLLVEYGRRYEMGLRHDAEEGVANFNDDRRRESNLWLLMKVKSEQPEKYAAMTRKKNRP